MSYQGYGGYTQGVDHTMREEELKQLHYVLMRQEGAMHGPSDHGGDSHSRVLNIVKSTLARIFTDLETAGFLRT